MGTDAKPLALDGRGVGERVKISERVNLSLQQNAKMLRANMTDAERILWQQLRAKRFAGFKFKRQEPLGRYIVDFVCYEAKLIVELDGGQHQDLTAQDAVRDDWLESQGFSVLRFWNNEFLTNQDGVLEVILMKLQLHPLP